VLAQATGDTGDTSTVGELIFGLHALNGLAILAVSGMILRQAGIGRVRGDGRERAER
jgi:hypothetical protein